MGNEMVSEMDSSIKHRYLMSAISEENDIKNMIAQL